MSICYSGNRKLIQWGRVDKRENSTDPATDGVWAGKGDEGMNHDSEFWSQMTLTDEMVARAISGGEGFRGKGQMATVLEDQRRKVGF